MTTTITNWNTEKGFGFVRLANGQRAFVHVSAIEPSQGRRVDLNGTKVVVEETSSDSKGTRVVRAFTEEEFIRREKVRVEVEAQRQSWKAEQAQKDLQRVEDAGRLEQILPQARVEVAGVFPLRKKEIILTCGVVVERDAHQAKVVSVHSVLGLTVQVEKQSYRFRLGLAYSEFEQAGPFTVYGWEGVSVERGVGFREDGTVYVRLSHELGAAEYVSYEPVWGQPCRQHRPNAQESKRGWEEIVQECTVSTPVGEATAIVLLYSQPRENKLHSPIRGGFVAEFNALKKALDSERQAELEKLWGDPESARVEFSVITASPEYSDEHETESEDGGKRSGGGRWTEHHGELEVKLLHPFFRHNLTFFMDQGLDVGKVREGLRSLVASNIGLECPEQDYSLWGYHQPWLLPRDFVWGQQYAARLLQVVEAQIPSQFKEERDLCALPPQWEKSLNFYERRNELSERMRLYDRIQHIAFGFAAVPGKDFGRRSIRYEDLFVSRGLTVIPLAWAKKLGLSGEPLAGPVRVWWQAAVTPEVWEKVVNAKTGLDTIQRSRHFGFFPEEISKQVEPCFADLPLAEMARLSYAEEWLVRAEKLLGQFSEADDSARAAADAEQKAQAQIAAGEILRDFTCETQFRKSIDQSAAWVIAADGSLLPPVDVMVEKNHRGNRYNEPAPFDTDKPYQEGTHRWASIIGGEYLVLRFRGSALGGAEERRIAEATFEVVKRPVAGETEAQLKIVNWVEHQIAVECGRIDSGSPSAAIRWQLVHGRFMRQLKKK